jgi:thymidine kinase
MYLEVKEKGSGKTTRLINEMVDFLLENADKAALIVTPLNSERKFIQKKIHERCGDLCSKRTEPSETIKQFVDEFDCMLPERLFLDKKAYYSTTNCESQKCKEILDVYEQIKTGSVKPNKFIKKHEL